MNKELTDKLRDLELALDQVDPPLTHLQIIQQVNQLLQIVYKLQAPRTEELPTGYTHWLQLLYSIGTGNIKGMGPKDLRDGSLNDYKVQFSNEGTQNHYTFEQIKAHCFDELMDHIRKCDQKSDMSKSLSKKMAVPGGREEYFHHMFFRMFTPFHDFYLEP